jgi:hypothetical protein
MSRILPNFLDSYMTYANDGYCPKEFHLWTGISILAAALGRKVAIRNGYVFHHPNLYIALVSHPAIGKSTAMERGTDLIEELKFTHNQDFKIIPNQCTEAALVDLLRVVEFYQLPSGPDKFYPHTSAYYFADEASSSALQNVYGDFVALMTDFYDCKKKWRKKLKGEAEISEITNVCTNLLIGTTFDFLKTIVNETSVMGGFASRLIYVVSKERPIRTSKFGQTPERDSKLFQALASDLAHINRLAGAVETTPEFRAEFDKYTPEFDRYLIGLNSPRLESINGRKFTHITKLAIILAVSEGDTLKVDARHFHAARELMDSVSKDNASIVSAAMIADKESQGGINQFILQSIKALGGQMPYASVSKIAIKHGSDLKKVKDTLDCMIASGVLELKGSTVYLATDPDSYI